MAGPCLIHGPSERQRHENICGKFLHNATARSAHTVTTQQFSFECLRRSPGQRFV